MDRTTLQHDFPDVYAEVVQTGVTQERERVEALLDTGSECGKLPRAIEFVKDGSCITQPKTQAAFLSARINNKDLDNRGDDNPPPIETPDNGATTADEDAKLTKFLDDRKKQGLSRA